MSILPADQALQTGIPRKLLLLARTASILDRVSETKPSYTPIGGLADIADDIEELSPRCESNVPNSLPIQSDHPVNRVTEFLPSNDYGCFFEWAPHQVAIGHAQA
jgi:hypothetical protein